MAQVTAAKVHLDNTRQIMAETGCRNRCRKHGAKTWGRNMGQKQGAEAGRQITPHPHSVRQAKFVLKDQESWSLVIRLTLSSLSRLL
jgi:hypothetical protein